MSDGVPRQLLGLAPFLQTDAGLVVEGDAAQAHNLVDLRLAVLLEPVDGSLRVLVGAQVELLMEVD